MHQFRCWSVARQRIVTLFTWFTFIEMTEDDLLFISIFVWAEFVQLAHCCSCCCGSYYCFCCYLICATYILYQFLFSPLLLPFRWLDSWMSAAGRHCYCVWLSCCPCCCSSWLLLLLLLYIDGFCLPLKPVAFEFALTATGKKEK